MCTKFTLLLALLFCSAGCSPKLQPLPRERPGVHLEGKAMTISVTNVDSLDVNMPEPRADRGAFWGFLGSLLWYDQATGTSKELIQRDWR